MNARRFKTAKFDGVAEEILKELRPLRAVTENDGQLRAGDTGFRFLNGDLAVVERAGDGLIAINRFERLATRAQPRIRQQIVYQALQPRGALHRVTNEFVGILPQFVL